MDKQWYNDQISVAHREYIEALQKCCDKISACQKLVTDDPIFECEKIEFLLFEKDREYIIDKLKTFGICCSTQDFQHLIGSILDINAGREYQKSYFIMEHFMGNLGFTELSEVTSKMRALHRLLDSDWVEFDGDIVITDPCYTKPDEDEKELDYNSLPLCRDTIYGDWSCTTFDKNTHKVLGQFCADGGMVCVDTLENVLKRKPDFEKEYSDWCRTIIRNFKGKVKFGIVCISPERDKEKFDTWNYEVQVVGEGVNKVTGEKIEFFTTQTGL